MTEKTRTIIFFSCAILFILFAPLAIIYSQGYRINFSPEQGEKIITQTGGLFLKIQPRQAEVYIDGKLKENTDFLFGSLLVENLIPGKYAIEVKKEGYSSWQKTLEIKEKTVTEAKDIVLFLKDPGIKTLAENIQDFWFSPDQKKLIFKEEDEKGWFLTLYEPEKDLRSRLIKKNDISTKEVKLLDITFSEDSKEIIIQTEISKVKRYFTLDITMAGLNPKETEALEAGEKEYIVGNYKFKEENGTLYFSENNSDSFQELFSQVKGFEFSPEGKKLAYFSDYEIWTMFLDNVALDKETGDRMFLMRLSEKIDNVFWLNSSYLIFNAGNTIKITEIDYRNRLNIIDFEEIKNPEIFWNENDKKLYIFSENTLSVTVPLLP